MSNDQLELMVSRVGSDRLRFTTSEANPDVGQREWARQWVRDMSAHDAWPPTRSDPPSLLTQAGSLAKAAVKFVRSGLKVVDQQEFDRRHSICEDCEQFNPAENRCKKCTCFLGVKPWAKSESCPLGKWEPAAEQGI